MLKKLLFSLFSVFLAFRSIELVRLINNNDPATFSWYVIIGLAILLNLFITGIFAFLGFTFPTSRILPGSYYQIENPRYLSYLYNIMRVKYFRSILLKTFWGKEKNRKRYFNGAKTGIEAFDTQTRQSEFGHLAALISILIVSFILLAKGHLALFIWTTMINIIGNLYPVILQRSHRIQIERVRKILKQRDDQAKEKRTA